MRSAASARGAGSHPVSSPTAAASSTGAAAGVPASGKTGSAARARSRTAHRREAGGRFQPGEAGGERGGLRGAEERTPGHRTGVPGGLGRPPALSGEIPEERYPAFDDPEHHRIRQVAGEDVLTGLVLEVTRLGRP